MVPLEVGKVFVDRGLQEGVRGVEVAVGEVVAHAGDLPPRDRRLGGEQVIGQCFDSLAFEGNKAETKTMLPVIRAFMTARQLPDVTVVADAGMVSEANQKAIEACGVPKLVQSP